MFKKNMLHHRWITFVVIFQLVFIWCLPVNAYAAIPTKPINYMDLDYTVRYGTEYNQVTVPISSDFFYFNSYDEASQTSYPFERGVDSYDFFVLPNRLYSLYIYPFSNYGISLKNVPVGSRLVFDLKIDIFSDSAANYYVPEFNRRAFYLGSNGSWLSPVVTEPIDGNFGDDLTITYNIEEKPDAIAFVPSVTVKRFKTATLEGVYFTVQLSNVSLIMDVPVAYWQQWQAEQNGKELGEIKDGIGTIIEGNEYTNGIANESNEQMSAASGKLDDLGDQLNSVEKPSADSMNVSADELFGGMAATSMLTAPVLEIWKNPVALSILTVVVTIVLISWVFFGKK